MSKTARPVRTAAEIAGDALRQTVTLEEVRQRLLVLIDGNPTDLVLIASLPALTLRILNCWEALMGEGSLREIEETLEYQPAQAPIIQIGRRGN